MGVLGSGPDGELWMAGGGTLESMSTAGAFTSYPGVLPAADTIGGIAADAGGADALWLTDTTASTVDRVALPATAPSAAAAASTRALRPSAEQRRRPGQRRSRRPR